MTINNITSKIPIAKQLLVGGILCVVACITKIINYIAFFNNKDGLFVRGFTTTLLDIVFYFCVALIIVISTISTFSAISYYKRVHSAKPIIVGYALFFAAVMFVVQGLSGFYIHFVELVQQKEMIYAIDIFDYIPIVIPFLTDVICTVCAFSFYQMAMSCFDDDGAPVRDIKSSIIPAVWGVFTVLQVVILTTNKLYIQNDIEQMLFSLLNVLFMYYIVQEYYFATKINTKSTFSLFVQISYAFLSVVIIVPYLILMLFGIKDAVPSMPYFAMFGISVYGVVSALRYILSALALKNNNKFNKKNES